MNRTGSWFIGAWFIGATVSLTAQAPQPTFRATTDLIVVETQVVNSDGRPIPALQPSDFRVKVGGRERKVVSATFVQYTDGTEGLTARRVENTGGPLPAGVPAPARPTAT